MKYPVARAGLAALIVLLLATPVGAAKTVSVVPAVPASAVNNCFPFGSNAAGNYTGYVYKDIPAFKLAAGDRIQFDLGALNDTDIVLDIAMAAATTNGGNVPDGSFVTIAANATATLVRGDAVAGNYELSFTATQGFTFAGGGLILRFLAKGALATDTTCQQTLLGVTASDASGFFVHRFYFDLDGTFPWDNGDTDAIVPFRIVTTGQIKVAVEMVATSGGQAALTVDQLDNSTWASIDATLVTAADVDTLAELAQYDVLVIGQSGDGETDRDWTPELAAIWASWVSSGEGAIVSTAWIAYSLQTAVSADMDALVPFAANPSSYTFCSTGISFTGSHPVTFGVGAFTPAYIETPASAVEGTALASACSMSSVIVGSTGAGRSVYLGVPYMGSAAYTDGLRLADPDRLLEQAVVWAADNDDDGLSNSLDCGPTDALVLGPTAVYADDDNDGYGAGAAVSMVCDAGPSQSTNNLDCDDGDAAVHPAATEVCDAVDVDEDCDGGADDADPQADATGKVSIFADADADGYGSGVAILSKCDPGLNEAISGGDCDDSRDSVHPGATEVCDADDLDEDCDGGADDADPDADAANKTSYFVDADFDGYGTIATVLACDAAPGRSTMGSDCDDSASAVHPGATEVCDINNVDEDCDGGADDADPQGDAIGKVSAYADSDGDGYGTGTAVLTCDASAGEVTINGDCDDGANAIHPGATEVCDDNNVDEDCDGGADDQDPEANATGKLSIYADADGDGYGAGTAVATKCDAGSGQSATGGDCDDGATAIHPGATEVAGDAVDEDCSGTVTCWADADGDGARDAVTTVASSDTDCSDVGEALTTAPVDCADDNGDRYPAATEIANGVDDNCDGTVDEGTSAFDDDGDGSSEDGGDCDDADDTRHPGATEAADGIDNDCDGTVDEGTSAADDDGDGLAEAQGDCDDDAATVYPDAEETANGVDDDCDGTVDEGTAAFDDDADGYTEDGGDCDDDAAAVNPDARETKNRIDDNCDGTIDEGLDSGGCSAGGGGSAWTMLSLLGLVIARTRRRRTR